MYTEVNKIIREVILCASRIMPQDRDFSYNILLEDVLDNIFISQINTPCKDKYNAFSSSEKSI